MQRTTAERRAAAENIFMHFHVFSCIFKQEHTISEDLKHVHAFWNILMPCQIDERSQRRACNHFHAISKNDARSHSRVGNICWITKEQTKQLNGRRELPDETAPNAHHPRELNTSTAPNSKSAQKFVELFSHFCSDFCRNPYFSTIFIEFCTDFDDFFFGISPNILENVEKS